MNISTYESKINALEAGGGGGGTSGGGNIDLNSITPIIFRREAVDENTANFYISKSDMDSINQHRPIILVLKTDEENESEFNIIHLDKLTIYEGELDSWRYYAANDENSKYLLLSMIEPETYEFQLGGTDATRAEYDAATDSYVFAVSFM